MPEIQLNYNTKLEIDITPTGNIRTWTEVRKGFSNIAESLNEVLHQASYLGDGGWGSTEVTGGQFTLTLTGKRYIGNSFQDWVFSESVMYQWGESRKTKMRLTRQDGLRVLWDVTLANITISGGDANTASDISLAIHGNGMPTIEQETILVVESTTPPSSGSSTNIVNGKTGITINFSDSVSNAELLQHISVYDTTAMASVDKSSIEIIVPSMPRAYIVQWPATDEHNYFIALSKGMQGDSNSKLISDFTFQITANA